MRTATGTSTLARLRRLLSGLLLGLSLVSASRAEPCRDADPDRFVSGAAQCLVIRSFGAATPEVLVVWLHGDLSSGGPADYHVGAARKFAEDHLASGVRSVALVRPGYPDGDGHASTVAFTQSGRQDHYTRQNVGEVAAAVQRLKTRFRPVQTLLVGHSGGAATAAILLGLAPDLVDGAVLVACPCDLIAWRAGRRPWTASENPLDWAARTAPGVVVHALTGSRDDNTDPGLAQRYIDALLRRGVTAAFDRIEGATHNSAFRAPEVGRAITSLIEASTGTSSRNPRSPDAR